MTIPSLEQRALDDSLDGEFYKKMRDRSELYTFPGRVVKTSEFVDLALERFGIPKAIIIDTWRYAEFQDAIGSSDIPNSTPDH